MAANLKSRLSRIRELGLERASSLGAGAPRRAHESPSAPIGPAKADGSAERRGAAPTAVPSFLGGWERIDDLVWRRTVRFRALLPDTVDPAPFRLARGAPYLPADAPVSRAGAASFRFFDLETSGLSGGTGTIAFLAAIGRQDEEGFAVRQLFLEDYPGEAAFVEAVLAELAGGPVVTYNGRAFDLPLLRTRCVMNAVPPPALGEDLDALYCARRLWKRVHGGASLGLLEREVLGREREEDVPGSAIPDIWFEYLRRGDHALMRAVMSHNASDVATLALLVARASRAFDEPRMEAASSAIDRAGLGRALVALGRPAEGEELLEAAAGDGDEAAGLCLSRRYRRQGRVEERRRVLGMLPRTYASCVERAKFHEHTARDFREALAWAAVARSLASSAEEEGAIAVRLARLEAKLAR